PGVRTVPHRPQRGQQCPLVLDVDLRQPDEGSPPSRPRPAAPAARLDDRELHRPHQVLILLFSECGTSRLLACLDAVAGISSATIPAVSMNKIVGDRTPVRAVMTYGAAKPR